MMPGFDNKKTIDQLETSIVLLEELAAKEQAIPRRYAILAARDHYLFACAALRHNQLDRAGQHLTAARTIIMQEVQA